VAGLPRDGVTAILRGSTDPPSLPERFAMRDLLEPSKTVTFTITNTPRRPAEVKTLQRLMQRQPHVQKGLKSLQKQRRQKDNISYIRAGKMWTNRARATRLTRVEPGATFTLQIIPHIVPDLLSVEKYLDAKAG
jgi:hypothetical protein